MRALKTEENTLSAKINEMKLIEGRLNSELETLISDGAKSVVDSLNDLTATAKNAREATSKLNSVIDDPATGLKTRSILAMRVITDAGEEAKKTILSAAGEVEKAMNESYEAGKLVAQYRHSDHILRVIQNEPVDRTTGLLALSNALKGAGYWLERNGMADLQTALNSLAKQLELRRKQ